MTVEAPVRSREQMMKSLELANQIRFARAALKRNLRDGAADVRTVIGDPAPEFASMKIYDLLMAVPRLGRVRVTALLNRCRIGHTKTVGGLTGRQRQELLNELDAGSQQA